MDWIDAATAADRLGVKPATLYAYVSRGVLKRRHDGRRSMFDAAEIEQLARRGRPRGQPPELVIESAITALGLDRPYYRGHDALTLARTHTFESVAELLWTDQGASRGGRPDRPDQDATRPEDPDGRALSRREESLLGGAAPPRREEERGGRALSRGVEVEPVGRVVVRGEAAAESGGWVGEAGALRAAMAAQRGLPVELLPLDRLQVIVTVLGASDSLRHQLDPVSVAATGRRLISGLVDALPLVGAENATGTVAERLWPRLTAQEPTPALVDALRAAMVLLADHELAASTLAARVAASAKADPYAVVLTGLGVLGGPLHGGASYGAERMLAEITDPGLAPRVIGERIRRGERIPGFGHSVYKNGDARGAALLDLVESAATGHDRVAAARAVLSETRRRRLPEHNIDMSLATLAAVAGMVPGAGEAVFAIARTAGWLAHAMEEYSKGTLLRLRASYTGPPPIPPTHPT
ncbi:citrate synthase [Nonomuraea endophytica]|uniref:citrate synthase (unknown stereospecificity) n=1 Tax=Nonomuraea endophytica TaxID=714136 RepID=A0A7W8EH54_9ACTN|nr:citrate/2-methylcitrate synthase [Nonomuraea endophytica]MBB5078192.1 citrate synthase [Nonomuraea endophytica]